MIKAILLDYGGVMSDGGGRNHISEKLAKNLGLPAEKTSKLMQTPAWRQHIMGLKK